MAKTEKPLVRMKTTIVIVSLEIFKFHWKGGFLRNGMKGTPRKHLHCTLLSRNQNMFYVIKFNFVVGGCHKSVFDPGQ